MPIWMAVEDEQDIHDMVLGLFEVWGIGGISFVDGNEAISWLDRADQFQVQTELPEMAILDIRLPHMSGIEVAQRIRRSPRLQNIAIILITAYRLSPDEEVEVVEQAQADMLLYKPLPGITALRAVLFEALMKRVA